MFKDLSRTYLLKTIPLDGDSATIRNMVKTTFAVGWYTMCDYVFPDHTHCCCLRQIAQFDKDLHFRSTLYQCVAVHLN